METTEQSTEGTQETEWTWVYARMVPVHQSSPQTETSDATSTEEETETEEAEEMDMLHTAPLHRHNAMENWDDYEIYSWQTNENTH